jgi:hypothetical protein
MKAFTSVEYMCGYTSGDNPIRSVSLPMEVNNVGSSSFLVTWCGIKLSLLVSTRVYVHSKMALTSAPHATRLTRTTVQT